MSAPRLLVRDLSAERTAFLEVVMLNTDHGSKGGDGLMGISKGEHLDLSLVKRGTRSPTWLNQHQQF